jgi:hypothetical protein
VKKQIPNIYVIARLGARIGFFRGGSETSTQKSLCVETDFHPYIRGRVWFRSVYEAFIQFLKERCCIQRVGLDVLSYNLIAQNHYHLFGFLEVSWYKDRCAQQS